MQTQHNITWDELKSQYYHNLKNLEHSIDTANRSSIELFRIYSQVMKKSNDSSDHVLKNFKDSWLRQIEEKNSRLSSIIRHEFDKFLTNPNPSEKDFNDFESALQQKLLHQSLGLLTDYQLTTQTFYDTWLKFWSK